MAAGFKCTFCTFVASSERAVAEHLRAEHADKLEDVVVERDAEADLRDERDAMLGSVAAAVADAAAAHTEAAVAVWALEAKRAELRELRPLAEKEAAAEKVLRRRSDRNRDKGREDDERDLPLVVALFKSGGKVKTVMDGTGISKKRVTRLRQLAVARGLLPVPRKKR